MLSDRAGTAILLCAVAVVTVALVTITVFSVVRRLRHRPPAAVSWPGRSPATVAIACTHFGPSGGYVSLGDVIIWAAPESPGVAVTPGQRLRYAVDAHTLTARVALETSAGPASGVVAP